VNREPVGAFIDAVYAIAVTILALEIPSTLGAEMSVPDFAAILVEYTLAFSLLFSFWIHHRRGNEFAEEHGGKRLWLNGAILLLVCLVPRATTLVFQYGGNVTVLDLDATLHGQDGWTLAEAVDLFYVGLVLFTDLMILVLVRSNTSAQAGKDRVRELRVRKLVMTMTVLAAAALSFLVPIQNRIVFVLIPLGVLFEAELAKLLGHAKPSAARRGSVPKIQ
jgi:uncharacterized membrane protein